MFNLQEFEWEPILEQIAGERVKSWEVLGYGTIEGFRGYCADKWLPTIAFLGASGREGQCTLFIKKFWFGGTREGERFALLAAHGVPAPRCYGVQRMGNDEEVLFLEFLPRIGFNTSDRDELRLFLSLMARLNAIGAPTESSPEVPSPSPAEEAVAIQNVLRALWRHAQSGELGEELRAFTSGAPLDRWLLLAERAAHEVAAQPTAWVHHDLAAQNVGWRASSPEMVVFDLHKMSGGPRTTDAMRWLGAPDDLGASALPSRQELGRFYLDELARLGGPRIEEKTFWNELRWCRLQHDLSQGWMLERALDGHADWTSNKDEARRTRRRVLLSALENAEHLARELGLAL